MIIGDRLVNIINGVFSKILPGLTNFNGGKVNLNPGNQGFGGKVSVDIVGVAFIGGTLDPTLAIEGEFVGLIGLLFGGFHLELLRLYINNSDTKSLSNNSYRISFLFVETYFHYFHL